MRIHIALIGHKQHIAAGLQEQCYVRISAFGVFLEVLTIVELSRIDENAAYCQIAFIMSLTHQGYVPGVQCTHGRYKARGELLPAEKVLHIGSPFKDNHRW